MEDPRSAPDSELLPPSRSPEPELLPPNRWAADTKYLRNEPERGIAPQREQVLWHFGLRSLEFALALWLLAELTFGLGSVFAEADGAGLAAATIVVAVPWFINVHWVIRFVSTHSVKLEPFMVARTGHSWALLALSILNPRYLRVLACWVNLSTDDYTRSGGRQRSAPSARQRELTLAINKIVEASSAKGDVLASAMASKQQEALDAIAAKADELAFAVRNFEHQLEARQKEAMHDASASEVKKHQPDLEVEQLEEGSDHELPSRVPRKLGPSASHTMRPPTSIVPSAPCSLGAGTLEQSSEVFAAAAAESPALAWGQEEEDQREIEETGAACSNCGNVNLPDAIICRMCGEKRELELLSQAAVARQELEAKQRELVAAAMAKTDELASTMKRALESKQDEVAKAIATKVSELAMTVEAFEQKPGLQPAAKAHILPCSLCKVSVPVEDISTSSFVLRASSISMIFYSEIPKIFVVLWLLGSFGGRQYEQADSSTRLSRIGVLISSIGSILFSLAEISQHLLGLSRSGACHRQSSSTDNTSKISALLSRKPDVTSNSDSVALRWNLEGSEGPVPPCFVGMLEPKDNNSPPHLQRVKADLVSGELRCEFSKLRPGCDFLLRCAPAAADGLQLLASPFEINVRTAQESEAIGQTSQRVDVELADLQVVMQAIKHVGLALAKDLASIGKEIGSVQLDLDSFQQEIRRQQQDDIDIEAVQAIKHVGLALAKDLAALGNEIGSVQLDLESVLQQSRQQNINIVLEPVLQAIKDQHVDLEQTLRAIKEQNAGLNAMGERQAICAIEESGKGKYPVDIDFNPASQSISREVGNGSWRFEQRTALDLDSVQACISEEIGKFSDDLRPVLQAVMVSGESCIELGPVIRSFAQEMGKMRLDFEQGLQSINDQKVDDNSEFRATIKEEMAKVQVDLDPILLAIKQQRQEIDFEKGRLSSITEEIGKMHVGLQNVLHAMDRQSVATEFEPEQTSANQQIGRTHHDIEAALQIIRDQKVAADLGPELASVSAEITKMHMDFKEILQDLRQKQEGMDLDGLRASIIKEMQSIQFNPELVLQAIKDQKVDDDSRCRAAVREEMATIQVDLDPILLAIKQQRQEIDFEKGRLSSITEEIGKMHVGLHKVLQAVDIQNVATELEPEQTSANEQIRRTHPDIEAALQIIRDQKVAADLGPELATLSADITKMHTDFKDILQDIRQKQEGMHLDGLLASIVKEMERVQFHPEPVLQAIKDQKVAADLGPELATLSADITKMHADFKYILQDLRQKQEGDLDRLRTNIVKEMERVHPEPVLQTTREQEASRFLDSLLTAISSEIQKMNVRTSSEIQTMQTHLESVQQAIKEQRINIDFDPLRAYISEELGVLTGISKELSRKLEQKLDVDFEPVHACINESIREIVATIKEQKLDFDLEPVRACINEEIREIHIDFDPVLHAIKTHKWELDLDQVAASIGNELGRVHTDLDQVRQTVKEQIGLQSVHDSICKEMGNIRTDFETALQAIKGQKADTAVDLDPVRTSISEEIRKVHVDLKLDLQQAASMDLDAVSACIGEEIRRMHVDFELLLQAVKGQKVDIDLDRLVDELRTACSSQTSALIHAQVSDLACMKEQLQALVNQSVYVQRIMSKINTLAMGPRSKDNNSTRAPSPWIDSTFTSRAQSPNIDQMLRSPSPGFDQRWASRAASPGRQCTNVDQMPAVEETVLDMF
eukprot:TRINITY_DN10432_c0_g1_i1.p1 TRINITY_DN10432_c0_g1~~TRINITY_DN10432_c0_g1_i1.p1  ORF type:complete len:1710 (+),score=363.93 TRINITY_DN10432_c0_g1_i1:83-5212(+)